MLWKNKFCLEFQIKMNFTSAPASLLCPASIKTMSNHVNKIEKKEFLNLFENVVEHTPKVAEELFKLRPFSNHSTFLESLANVIEALSHEEKVRK